MANTYIDFYWENPLRTYNKVKKYFKRIKPKFQWTFGFRNKAKILEINSFDLMWKDKWNSPRHEYNPRMFFSLFNFIHLYVEWTSGSDSVDDTAYWEAILDWVYYGKDLQEACTTGWTNWNEETQMYEKIEFVLLKEPYHTAFKSNALNNLYYESTK
jgi:hypothetical protein